MSLTCVFKVDWLKETPGYSSSSYFQHGQQDLDWPQEVPLMQCSQMVTETLTLLLKLTERERELPPQ